MSKSIVREAFDFREISKRAVARNWRRFDPDQKEAFRMVFTKMLTGRYIARLQQEYSGQEIVYVGEEMMRADRALVKTKVPRNGSDVAIDGARVFSGNPFSEVTSQNGGVVEMHPLERLLLDAPTFMTGAVVPVDGGQIAA